VLDIELAALQHRKGEDQSLWKDSSCIPLGTNNVNAKRNAWGIDRTHILGLGINLCAHLLNRLPAMTNDRVAHAVMAHDAALSAILLGTDRTVKV
jgi:hypothetical protein